MVTYLSLLKGMSDIEQKNFVGTGYQIQRWKIKRLSSFQPDGAEEHYLKQSLLHLYNVSTFFITILDLYATYSKCETSKRALANQKAKNTPKAMVNLERAYGMLPYVEHLLERRLHELLLKRNATWFPNTEYSRRQQYTHKLKIKFQ